MSHAYHEGLPGHHPDQLLHDGCPECEDRAAGDGDQLICGLDGERFVHAWHRAAAWRRDGTARHLARAEMNLLLALWGVQVQLQRVAGWPIGEIPRHP